MNTITSARSANAVQSVATTTATPLVMRVGARPSEQRSLHERAGSTGMSDAMRTVIWITGVAFGIAAPGAFAQGSNAAGTTQTNPVFQKLDANHDGFVSREEAKQDPAVSAVFSQADTNRDGKLDENEFIKAVSISQRAAAEQYALDSEITAKVKAALLRAEGIRSLEVSVQTYRGRVQLAGFVDSKDQVAQAGKIAARASGVKSVLNNLTVK